MNEYIIFETVLHSHQSSIKLKLKHNVVRFDI